MMRNFLRPPSFFLGGILLALACGTLFSCSSRPPLQTVDSVDLDRYMGIWYVNAHIPSGIEKDCTNAVEFYEKGLPSDPGPAGARKVNNLFTCRNESSVSDQFSHRTPDEVKLHAHGWVVNERTNAEWNVRFFWPVSLGYYVLYVSPDYSEIVVGHPSRDFLWIMSRSSRMPRARIDELMKLAIVQGFDASQLRIVPFTEGFTLSTEALKAKYR